MAFEIKAGLRLRVPLQFLDDADKPEAVQNPGATSSDESVATVSFDSNGDLLVHRVGVGNATITVTADADLSDAISPISNLFDVFCSPVQASKIVFGAPTTEPDVNLSADNIAAATEASGADATVGAPATEAAPADEPTA